MTIFSSFQSMMDTMLKDHQEEIADALKQMDEAPTQTADTVMVTLLKTLLEKISTDQSLDFDSLSPEKQAMLLKEIERIAFFLAATHATRFSAAQIKAILSEALYRCFSNKYQALQEEEKDRFHTLDEKTHKRLKEEAERMLAYEAHKILNPRQLAGETRQQNFENNVRTRGLKEAKKYAGGSEEEIEKYSKSHVKELEKQHQQVKKGGFDFFKS